MPTDVVEDAACVLDWLGPLVLADAGAAWLAKKEGATEGFVWRRWDALPTIVAPPLSAGIAPQTEAGIDFEYPFVAATNEPAKVTVTGLRKRIAADADGDDETAGYGTWMRRAPSSEPDDVSAVERGVLHHRFFEHVDFAKAGDVAGVVAEVERMTREGRFTGAEASALDTVALARFVASDLGARIRGTTGRVRREFPFTLRLDVADLRELGLESARELPDGEFVVAQGVVDLVVIESGVAWIVDYKTDRVAPGGEQAKADGYRAQLRVYALAVERILGIPVTGCWLHFLTTGVTTEV